MQSKLNMVWSIGVANIKSQFVALVAFVLYMHKAGLRSQFIVIYDILMTVNIHYDTCISQSSDFCVDNDKRQNQSLYPLNIHTE